MPGYLTHQNTVSIAGADDLIIRSLLDREQFADPLGHAERIGISSATWPLFGLLWPSGKQLASRMALHRLQPRQRILEIGCGLALASLVGHRRGADVTASDCHPLTARFLSTNLRLNALPPMKYRHGAWAQVVAAAGDGPQRPNSAVRGRYELIIGSDVLYDRDASTALAGFIGRHAAPEGEVWIVDPDRGNRPTFNRRMAALGYALEDCRIDTLASLGALAYRGRLLVYRRGG